MSTKIFPEANLKPLTLIPLSLIVAFTMGIFWFTSLYSQTVENTKAITEVKQKQDIYIIHLKEISERLARIEGRLNDRSDR